MVDASYYKGNENLLKAEAQIKWTPELIDEFEKCAKNIFVKCKVQTVETKLLTFNQFLDSVTSQTAWPKVARQDVG